MASEFAVEILDLAKVYKSGKILVPALRGVNLRVRRRELALGFKNWMILMLFLNEAVLIGVIGGAFENAVGVVLGYGMAMLAGQVRGNVTQEIQTATIGCIAPIFPLDGFITVWLFSVALSVFAGVYPAWRASRLDPVVALRKE